MRNLVAVVFLLATGYAGAQATSLGSFKADTQDPQYPLHLSTAWATSATMDAGTEVNVTIDPPTTPTEGQWQFIQVSFWAQSPGAAAFICYTDTSNTGYRWDSQDEDLLPSGMGAPTNSTSLKYVRKASTTDEFDNVRFPSDVYFAKQSASNVLRFRNQGTGTGQWKVKVRAFYLKKPATAVSAIAGAVIQPALGDFSTFLPATGAKYLLAGQDVKLKVTSPGILATTYDSVQIFDNNALLGEAVWDAVAGGWLFTAKNLEHGSHSFKAYFLKAKNHVGWSAGLEVSAGWFSVNVAFGVAKDLPLEASGELSETFLGDSGQPYGMVRNDIDIPEQFDWPNLADWKYGWVNADGSGNQMTTNGRDDNPLYDSFCRFRSPAGVPLKWEVAVPTGTYRIKLTAGDSSHGPEVYKMLIEDKEITFRTERNPAGPRAGWHDEEVLEVQVTDGRLTLQPVTPDDAPKLNFLSIQQISHGQELYVQEPYVFHQYSGGEALSVFPLSGQKGIRAVGDKSAWGINFSSNPIYHYAFGNSIYPFGDDFLYEELGTGTEHEDIAFWLYAGRQPFVYFGSRFGSDPLYENQAYSYAVDAGYVQAGQGMRVRVFDKNTGALVTTLPLNVDRLVNWSSFPAGSAEAAKGMMESFDFSAHSLKVDVSLSYSSGFSTNGKYKWVVSHRGGKPEYVYSFESYSNAKLGIFTVPIARNTTGSPGSVELGSGTFSMLFAFSVDPANPLTSITSSSHFEGRPKPSSYYGTTPEQIRQRSLAGLGGNVTMNGSGKVLNTMVPVTDPYWANLSDLPTGNSRSLDTSPELRLHTLLNEFIVKMKNDPLALANYVQNEIGLSDAIGYNQGYSAEGVSIDPAGIQRGALGCFLEGQGSPHEQCALLVYMLRKAGVPAAYVKTDRNRLLMDSETVSKMLMTGIQRDVDVPGLVALNYPWVVAYLDSDNNGTSEWTHLFPWIKDVEIQEGVDLYSRLPADYNTGWKWVWQYFQGNEDVLPFQLRRLTANLDATTDGTLFKKTEVFNESAHGGEFPREYEDLKVLKDYDQPYQLFPRFVKWKLREQGTDLSIDDIGLKKRTRPRYYSTFQDFPKPTVVAGNLVGMLGFNEIPRIFDTVRYEVVRKTPAGLIEETLINSGDQLLCDLHNRKVYVERWNFIAEPAGEAPKDEIGLVMAPFDAIADGDLSNDFSPYSSGSYADWDPIGVDQGQTGAILANGRKGRRKSVTDPVIATPSAQVELRIIHKRQRNNASRITTTIAPSSDFGATPGLSDSFTFSSFIHDTENEGLEYVDTNKIGKGLFALCIQTGKVSKAMLEAHVRNLWKFESASTPNNPDMSLGTRTYLMGMSYWEYMSRFKEELGMLHKVVIQGDYGHLFAGLKYDETAAGPSIPSIDIYRGNTNSHLFNASAHPASGQSRSDVAQNFYHLLGCQGSAYEHGVMEKYYGQVGAISTMRLFHLAKAARVANPADAAANELKIVTSENRASSISSISVPHEIDGTVSSLNTSPDLSSFKGEIAGSLDPYYNSTRAGFSLCVMAPKFYKYYDSQALALECAGMAPIPDAGIMGGYIVPLSKYRAPGRHVIQAEIYPAIATSTTPHHYGNFTSPVNLGASAEQRLLSIVDVGQPVPNYTVSAWTEGGQQKILRSWKLYQNTQMDSTSSNDVLLKTWPAVSSTCFATTTASGVTVTHGIQGYDVTLVPSTNDNVYQIRLEACYMEPLPFTTHVDPGDSDHPTQKFFIDLTLQGTAQAKAYYSYRVKNLGYNGSGEWTDPLTFGGYGSKTNQSYVLCNYNPYNPSAFSYNTYEFIFKRQGADTVYYEVVGGWSGSTFTANITVRPPLANGSSPFTWAPSTPPWPAN